jgi:trimeric autotransporter adhesin
MQFVLSVLRAWAWMVVGLAAALALGCASASDGGGGDGTAEAGADAEGSGPDVAARRVHVGGTVSGLRGTVVLRNNDADDLVLTNDGPFTFLTTVAEGATYEVTVAAQPPGETCAVGNAAGRVGADDVTNVSIACTPNRFSIGGSVAGLSGTVVLRNGPDTLSLDANGPFTFPTLVPGGGAYQVTIATQPASQRCAITGGGGVVGTANVTSVMISCAMTYAVGGTVAGLAGTLVLHDNGGDALTVSANGPFTFATALPSGAPYDVSVVTQPTNQICGVQNGAGTVGSAAVTDVAIACAPTYAVGGAVSGLAAGTVTLQLNGAGNLAVSADGAFTFVPRLPDAATYAVTVLTQPTGQLCAVTQGTGAIAGASVTTVAVACRALAVVVNEVHARPATGAVGDANGDQVRDASQDEFVELMNTEAQAVDMSGFVLETGGTLRYTFGAGVTLPAGGRAVVFGGGTPGGSFGGALTFVTSGLVLTDAPAAPLTIALKSMAAGGVQLDAYTYNAGTFGSSCTTSCASQVRAPEGTGAFVAHTTAAGSAGILWSPGVAAALAIPKVAPFLSAPQTGASSVSVKTWVTVQLDMFATTSDFDNTRLKLYASPCATLAGEVTSFSSIGPGLDAAQGRLVPAADLAFGATYCVAVDATLRSAAGTPLAAPVSYQFATRAAQSVPANTVVVSEYGGCRMNGASGATACGGTGANDEFVELYNPTSAAIDLSGWFIQRRAAGGSAACWATLPAGASIAAGGFYLVGGAGYTASRYAGAPAADFVTTGTQIGGGSESVLLVSSAGSCTGTSAVIDAVSAGTITDPLASLELPPFPGGLVDGTSIERKACYDSTGDAAVTTGMLTGGGHASWGNSERIGASNADFVLRAAPGPQNRATPAELRACP